jgi:hypothetical protein
LALSDNAAVRRVEQERTDGAGRFLLVLPRHQDSGLDYVTVFALGRTMLRELPSEPVDRSVGSAACQLEG